MNHVMLDLETLGTTPGCCILSVGAVVFDPRNGPDEGRTFYSTVNVDDQLAVGLLKDQSTVEWWQRQRPEAWEAATKFPKPPKVVLEEFRKWWLANKATFVWAQGSNYDPVLIEILFQKFDVLIPWKYYNTRDTRTVYHMCKVPKNAVPRKGVHHNALDDAVHQAKMVAWGASRMKLEARS